MLLVLLILPDQLRWFCGFSWVSVTQSWVTNVVFWVHVVGLLFVFWHCSLSSTYEFYNPFSIFKIFFTTGFKINKQWKTNIHSFPLTYNDLEQIWKSCVFYILHISWVFPYPDIWLRTIRMFLTNFWTKIGWSTNYCLG